MTVPFRLQLRSLAGMPGRYTVLIYSWLPLGHKVGLQLCHSGLVLPIHSWSGLLLWLLLLSTTPFLLAPACGRDGTTGTPSPSVVDRSPAIAPPTIGPSPTFESSVPRADNVTIQAAEHADLGTIVVDGRRRTLYLFTEDDRNQSSCADRC